MKRKTKSSFIQIQLFLPLFSILFTTTQCFPDFKDNLASRGISLSPGAHILSPKDESTFMEGEKIIIDAEARKTDYNIRDTWFEVTNEDGETTEYYRDARTVMLDTRLVLNNLAPGRYKITFFAEDEPPGHVGDDSITITVLGKDSTPSTKAINKLESTYFATGALCDEADESSRPMWQLDLMKNDTGKMVGTLQFHLCPDGGYIVYLVEEISSTQYEITLEGMIKESFGAIALHPDAVDYQVFKFDILGKTIKPNLVDL
jgi:hypothetical protein